MNILLLICRCIIEYKIGKSATAEGKISIVLFTRLAELENDCNITQGCRRFPYLVLFPVFDFISLAGKRSMECKQKQLGGLVRNKIKHRKKYKIGKSPTPLGNITIVL
jgi:hypothetical protein